MIARNRELRSSWPGRAGGEPFAIRVSRGTAAELHAEAAGLVGGPGPASRLVRVAEATDRCVVLGSAQPDADVDAGRLGVAGWGLARRRSGGAAVVVGPGEVVWVDVVVPAGDPLWSADVRRAGSWLASSWSEALTAAGVAAASPWMGRLLRGAWSERVCFAGLGPGEVTARGRKVLGVSQRRTRAGALLQCALLVRWAPEELLDVLALTDLQRRRGGAELAGVAAGVGPALAARALAAFLESVPSW